MKNLLLALTLFSTSVLAQSNATLNPSQTYVTGDLVQQTGSGGTTPWVNGVYQNSLTCWGWGNPGYCGPNAIVRPGNDINFSFGTTDLHQIVNLANVLPYTGTGLLVKGYNFGFTAKNGNGWDDGRVDVLDAYVKFYDSKGNVVVNNNYNLNYKFNWTNFNYSETFTSPFATKDLSTARFGFVGRDNNGWAGPYGPEINNVTFSLKYSVDPCFVNVLSSPTCPGYLDALAKLTPPALSTTASSDPLQATTNTNNIAALLPTPSQFTTTTSLTPAPTAATTNTATVSTSASVSKEVNTNSVSIGLSVIAKNQQKEQALAMQTAQNAVAATEQSAQQAQADAVNVAMASSAASIQSLSNSSKNIFTPPKTESSNSMGMAVGGSFSLSLLPTPGPQFNAKSESRSTVQIGFSNDTNIRDIVFSNATPTFDSQKMLTDRTDPINQVLEGRLEAPGNNSISPKVSVNTNVANNEVAGGVDITKMAVLPTGYNQYLNFVISDASFYAPKEIYRGQKTVDNVRALRQMSSDRLHQEMVNQQYKR